jgi:hypothetical protein
MHEFWWTADAAIFRWLVQRFLGLWFLDSLPTASGFEAPLRSIGLPVLHLQDPEIVFAGLQADSRAQRCGVPVSSGR